jgi:hypothetical protein
MRNRDAVRFSLLVFIAAAPSYLVERITEYYFLSGNSNGFAVWSSLRTPLFITLVLLAAIESGYAVESLKMTIGAFILGVVVLVSLLYVFCPPRGCYSTGLDGLEPLRVGYFLACLGTAGASMGHYARTREEIAGRFRWFVVAANIGAITYYPVVFTVAGTKLLAPIAPIPVVAIVFIPSLVFAGRITRTSNWRVGFLITAVANLLVLAVTLGIARQYLPQISSLVYLMLAASLIGTAVGCATAKSSGYGPLLASNKLLSATVLILLLSTVVFLPDAVAGVAPTTPTDGAASGFVIGPSVYVGGFDTQPFIRPESVAVSMSFAGTNVSSIQPDNYLSAGLGVHATNCCVDGIDYGFRFDVYLFHDGSEALVASSWEDCDWIMACGGHSWQDLLFLQKEQLNASLASQLHLFLQWKGRAVYWSYAVGEASPSNFTSFMPPAKENAYFTVGTLGGIPATPQPPEALRGDSALGALAAPNAKGYYFFQYGVMSAYPIGHLGWQVTFVCPSYLEDSSWTCIPHSDTIQGDQAYWKAIWRWGEPYYDAMPSVDVAMRSVTFSDSKSTVASFSPLW